MSSVHSQEKLYAIIEEIVKEVDLKDELRMNSMSPEEKKAVHLLQTYNAILVGARKDQEILFPGENFNKLLNNGPEKFFSRSENRKKGMLQEQFLKNKWIPAIEKLAIFVLLVILLCLLFFTMYANA